jgi:hypothetical protein
MRCLPVVRRAAGLLVLAVVTLAIAVGLHPAVASAQTAAADGHRQPHTTSQSTKSHHAAAKTPSHIGHAAKKTTTKATLAKTSTTKPSKTKPSKTKPSKTKPSKTSDSGSQRRWTGHSAATGHSRHVRYQGTYWTHRHPHGTGGHSSNGGSAAIGQAANGPGDNTGNATGAGNTSGHGYTAAASHGAGNAMSAKPAKPTKTATVHHAAPAKPAGKPHPDTVGGASQAAVVKASPARPANGNTAPTTSGAMHRPATAEHPLVHLAIPGVGPAASAIEHAAERILPPTALDAGHSGGFIAGGVLVVGFGLVLAATRRGLFGGRG